MTTVTVTPSHAAQAYRSVAGTSDAAGTAAGGTAAGGTAAGGFGEALGKALGGVVDTARDAEGKATSALSGNGSLTDVVSAVSRAELALQTTVAIRDKVVAAYQDIMRMPI